MAGSTLARLLVLFCAFVATIRTVVIAAPTAEIDARAPAAQNTFITSPPYFVIYTDEINYFPSAADLAGYNVFVLAFWLLSGASDQSQNWAALTDAQRSSIKSSYNAAGISLMVSAFGETDLPVARGADPTKTAQTLAAWVKKYNLDGVDVDFEDFSSIEKGTGEKWLITFTQTLRSLLPEGQYLISHAPIAPWFQPSTWPGGGYLKVDQTVGSLINFYNIQFYNQGAKEYITCAGLLTESSSESPKSALFQIAASGVSLNKLLIGKPAVSSDQNGGGYMSPATLATCVSQAAAKGWKGGVMEWEFHAGGSAFIKQVHGSAFPIGSSGSSTASPTKTSSTTTKTSTTSSSSKKSSTTTSSPTKTSTTSKKSSTTSSSSTKTSTNPSSSPTSGNNCEGIPAWSSGDAYPGGSEVTYDDQLWTSAYWSDDATPGGSADVWTTDSHC